MATTWVGYEACIECVVGVGGLCCWACVVARVHVGGTVLRNVFMVLVLCYGMLLLLCSDMCWMRVVFVFRYVLHGCVFVI